MTAETDIEKLIFKHTNINQDKFIIPTALKRGIGMTQSATS